MNSFIWVPKTGRWGKKPTEDMQNSQGKERGKRKENFENNTALTQALL